LVGRKKIYRSSKFKMAERLTLAEILTYKTGNPMALYPTELVR
jgi:hypothetical protein